MLKARCPMCGQEFPEHRNRGFQLTDDADIRTVIPKRATKKSAGCDFSMPYDVEIGPFCYSEPIPLGIKAYMKDDEFLMKGGQGSTGK